MKGDETAIEAWRCIKRRRPPTAIRGMSAKEIEKSGDVFLKEFSDHIRNETNAETQNAIRLRTLLGMLSVLGKHRHGDGDIDRKFRFLSGWIEELFGLKPPPIIDSPINRRAFANKVTVDCDALPLEWRKDMNDWDAA